MDVPTGIHSAWPGLFIEMVLYLQNCDWSWRWNSVIFCPPDMIISKRLHVSHTMVGITSTSYQSRIYKQSFPAWFMMFKLGFTTMFCGFQILKYTCKINRVVYFVDLWHFIWNYIVYDLGKNYLDLIEKLVANFERYFKIYWLIDWVCFHFIFLIFGYTWKNISCLVLVHGFRPTVYPGKV